jgi:excinuclease UvrABC nuclease subunit
MYRFIDEERRNIPTGSGVYTFLVKPDIASHPACSFLMYVGRSNSLRQRFGHYLYERNRNDGRPKIVYLLNKYADHLWFCFALLPEDATPAQENALITAYIPPFNNQFPAEIRAPVGAFR